MPTKRTLNRQLADARTARDRAIEQRDDARATRDTAVTNQRRLARQLSEVRDELDAVRKSQPPATVEQEPEGWAQERATLRRALFLSERARASLDAQVVQLGQINDRLCRRAQDRAVAAEVTR